MFDDSYILSDNGRVAFAQPRANHVWVDVATIGSEVGCFGRS